MGNLGTLETLCTWHRTKTNNIKAKHTKQTKTMINMGVTKHPWPNPGVRNGLVVPHLIQQSTVLIT